MPVDKSELKRDACSFIVDGVPSLKRSQSPLTVHFSRNAGRWKGFLVSVRASGTKMYPISKMVAAELIARGFSYGT
jgi:hypothetical protein